jgi:hypothetical protein
MNWTKRVGKWLMVGSVIGGTLVSVGCLARPVGTQPPTTKVNFTSTLAQPRVDKVDLLFMIDNSASMADKQEILSEAVPSLLKALLQPKCIDEKGAQVDNKTAIPDGTEANNYNCPPGSEPEFAPVTDMHIGIISSSLGSFGGDICLDDSTHNNNDRAYLLNRVKGEGPVQEAAPSNFLSWFPTNDENADQKRHPKPPTTPITDLDALSTNFQKLVGGVEQKGCGLEAQLESFYRFLIQPDPWKMVTVSDGKASLGNDIDVELLKQRADFLREDSLVAIIELTDEDDSSADPLSVGGQGWGFMTYFFPGNTTVFRSGETGTTAFRATSACQTNPAADGKDGKVACTSCGLAGCNDPSCRLIKEDPECQKNGGYYGPTEDSVNVRFHHMKQRFGVDPQYPVKRYIDGLRNPRVPDRSTEHTVNGKSVSGYIGTPKCTNPLFAKNLPREAGQEICTLARSNRTPDRVFFAVVGGVPNELLHFDATDRDKRRITKDDWNKILGKDPLNFNYEDIDPHMIQSVSARPGVPPPSDTRGDNGDPRDPVGRDWNTGADDKVGANDLQYACTFDLPTKRICTDGDASCDCQPKQKTNPPLCGPNPGEQIKAKAYPTTREFMVVRALGDQGVIASLCPISLKDKSDPTYGYNPAVTSIVDRLKDALTPQCLPQRLTRDVTSTDPNDKDKVPCLVLVQLGEVTDSCGDSGLAPPAPEILAKFLEEKKAESGDIKNGGTDLTKLPVCEVPQLVVPAGETCKKDGRMGWCYVENGNGKTPARLCPQALVFSKATGALAGAQFSLQCIQQFSAEAGSPSR